MSRPWSRFGDGLATVRVRRFLQAAVLASVVGLGLACTPGRQVAPASLAGSRQLVSVTYPAPQDVRAQAADGDTLLTGVVRLDGWPVRVRHDTVDLQVARWYANGRGHELERTNFTVAVPPEARAKIRNPQAGANDSFTQLLLVAVVVVAVVLVLLSQAYEDY